MRCACQDHLPAGCAGVVVISVTEAPLALPGFATEDFITRILKEEKEELGFFPVIVRSFLGRTVTLRVVGSFLVQGNKFHHASLVQQHGVSKEDHLCTCTRSRGGVTTPGDWVCRVQ